MTFANKKVELRTLVCFFNFVDDKDMIKSGDKLKCTCGNDFFVEGSVYTVGNIISDKFFQINVGANDEHWYATKDSEGIYVRFDAEDHLVNDAFFALLKRQC